MYFGGEIQLGIIFIYNSSVRVILKVWVVKRVKVVLSLLEKQATIFPNCF